MSILCAAASEPVYGPVLSLAGTCFVVRRFYEVFQYNLKIAADRVQIIRVFLQNRK
jgi:hypothetical protein